MILSPLEQHDPRLRQVCAEVPRAALRTREVQLEIEAILDYVYGIANKDQVGEPRDLTKPNTAGLAANQVGILKQICAVDMAVARHGYTDMHILVNPRVVWRSKAMVGKPEGCVNFATTWGMTRRARSVRVEALDRSGNELTLKLVGWPAILIQHEIDHLQGHLFIDRLVDATRAHDVPAALFSEYRKMKPTDWTRFVDVSGEVVGD